MSMQFKVSFKWAVFIGGIGGIIFSSIVFVFLILSQPAHSYYANSVLTAGNQTPQNPVDSSFLGFSVFPEQTSSSTGQAGIGLPIYLKIPKINVDSAVENVGLAPDGAMDITKNIDNVSWFELGPRPGENGNAVIAGHYGRKNGKASVFDELYKLRKGDKIYIEDDKGVIITFVVRETRRYDPKANTSDIFGSNDGKAHLNLITCEGVWDKKSKQYSQRLVVFADKE